MYYWNSVREYTGKIYVLFERSQNFLDAYNIEYAQTRHHDKKIMSKAVTAYRNVDIALDA